MSGSVGETVYEHLHRMAAGYMRREREEHTLQATALVNEAWMNLARDGVAPEADEATFYNFAAEAMRRILIDHARRRGRDKRGGGWMRQPISVLDLAEPPAFEEVVALEDAIAELEARDARAAQIVRLRFFAGLDVETTARVIGASPRTVAREWDFARAWLFRALGPPE